MAGHRRLFRVVFESLRVLTPLVVALAWLAPAQRARADERDSEPPRPSFVLLYTDDQRWDALGAAGNPLIETPHLDRLAAQGALFTRSFCTTSICATSRASLLTGQYASRHGIHDFHTPLSPEQFDRSLPGQLRRAGYRLGFIGKWGLGGELPVQRYDVWHGFSGQGRYFERDGSEHLTHRLGDQALAFLDGCQPGEPFCLQLSFKAPHVQDGDDKWPFPPDPRYGGRYADVTIPLPATATDAALARLPDFLQTSEGRVRWQVRFADAAMFQKSVKDYYRLIAGIDDVVGRVREKLAERGLTDETVIVFTSDNGFFLGEHGLAGKWLMYEESIRVPLVIHDPRRPQVKSGREVDGLALNIDVAPTILDLAGVDVRDQMQGRSLVPLLADPEGGDWPEEFFYEHRFAHPRIPPCEGVWTPRWKYVRYYETEPVYEQLFDLAGDPHELENLAGHEEHAEVLKSLRQRTDEWAERVK